jgi:uncharacterized MnhB-related membrane protein
MFLFSRQKPSGNLSYFYQFLRASDVDAITEASPRN